MMTMKLINDDADAVADGATVKTMMMRDCDEGDDEEERGRGEKDERGC